jgi:hypothetical protein
VTGTGVNTGATVNHSATSITCNASGYSGTGTLSGTCSTQGQNLTVSGCTVVPVDQCTATPPADGYSPSIAQTVNAGTGPGPFSCATGYTGTPTFNCTTNGSFVSVSGCSRITCNVDGTAISNPLKVYYNATTVDCFNGGYEYGTASLSQTCQTQNQVLTAGSCTTGTYCYPNTLGDGYYYWRGPEGVVMGTGPGPISCSDGYTGTPTYNCVNTGDDIDVTGCNLITCNVTGTGITSGKTVDYDATTVDCDPAYFGSGTLSGTCKVQNQNLTATGCSSTASPTGGTITTSGGYRIHTFTSSGTFTIYENKTVEYLIVGGGGGGGEWFGGGGGGGGVRSGSSSITGVGAGTNYAVNIGTGGAAGSATRGNNGGNSSFNSITSTGGGGGGGAGNPPTTNPQTGGSGGGGAGGGNYVNVGVGAAGTSGQGNAGGSITVNLVSGAGGGGAGSSGFTHSHPIGGAGGSGLSSSIDGTAKFYGCGGGGATQCGSGSGASSGGSNCGGNGSATGTNATQGMSGRGGGGGGGTNSGSCRSAAGGSGVVIIRYAN